MDDCDIQRVVDALRHDARVRLVYLFGSRASGEARDGSDTDIAVLVAGRLDWGEEKRFRGAVAAVAGEDIDLVLLNDAGVVLRHEVVVRGRCLFARDPREQAEFEIQAVSQYLDFQPILRLQDEYLRARVEERRRGAAS
ncbi:MAG: type VII toxin-antitoxin system MntA family adenylyltransferase antitoxin [Candidatus Binatia bacterium]